MLDKCTLHLVLYLDVVEVDGASKCGLLLLFELVLHPELLKGVIILGVHLPVMAQVPLGVSHLIVYLVGRPVYGVYVLFVIGQLLFLYYKLFFLGLQSHDLLMIVGSLFWEGVVIDLLIKLDRLDERTLLDLASSVGGEFKVT
jgi:hypothetical protein